MASFNKITIVGYLGKDPEIRYLPDSTAVCSFSVATTEKRSAAGNRKSKQRGFASQSGASKAKLAANISPKARRCISKAG